MYLSDYLVFILALLACMVFSMIAGGKVKSAYSAYSRVPCRSGLSGRETAERLLRMNGVYDIALGRVSGELTDHYAPNQSIVNLSTGTADSRSVAAAAVAAHEIGHVNFGSRLAMPLVLIGILLDTYVRTANPDTGFYVAMVGVVLYGGSFLFSLVTLPVELDASRRAGEMLLAAGVIAEDELPAAKNVLSAAALTYLASLLTSFVYFLRFLLYVLSVFGKRDRQ